MLEDEEHPRIRRSINRKIDFPPKWRYRPYALTRLLTPTMPTPKLLLRSLRLVMLEVPKSLDWPSVVVVITPNGAIDLYLFAFLRCIAFATPLTRRISSSINDITIVIHITLAITFEAMFIVPPLSPGAFGPD